MEKRSKARQTISKEIQYRTTDMAVFEKGLLYDISHMGALFSAQRDIALQTSVHLVIPTDDSQTADSQFIATVVRKNYHKARIRKFEYGCRFNFRQAGERRVASLAIKYRTADMGTFEEGLLWNLSRKGALFSSQRDIAINSQVHLVIPAEDPKNPPKQAIAVIVRKETYEMRRRKYGYGCKFKQTIEID